MNAKHVVCGHGTLIPTILLFNISLKYCYSTAHAADQYTIKATLPNYIKKWENTDLQKELMLKYKGTIIKFPGPIRVSETLVVNLGENNFTTAFTSLNDESGLFN